MKKLKWIMYIILIVVIIVLSLTIYSKASKGEEDIKDKTLAEVKYLESKLVKLFNGMNQIEFENYSISVTKVTGNETSNSSQSSSGGSSSSDSSSQQSEGSSSGGDSQSSSGGGNNSNQETKKYNMQEKGVLTNSSQIDWDLIKNEVEIMYSSIPAVTLDLYEINVNQSDILKFNSDLDQLTISVKEENKEKTLSSLSTLYQYLPVFLQNCSDDEIYKTIVNVKSNVFIGYSILDSDDWNAISDSITKAIDNYSVLLTGVNIEKENQYSINKGYIMLNELQNAVNLKDKEIFLIKYKNLLEEINGI